MVAESPLHAGLARITLEAEGLTVQLRQMELWSVAVEVLYTEGAAPSVWVPEEQAEQARHILEKHRKKLHSQATEPQVQWRCSNCNERNDSNFESCWQCGQAAPEVESGSEAESQADPLTEPS